MNTVFVHRAVTPEVSPPSVVNLTSKPESPKTWGIVTISVSEFSPKGLRSRPPSIADSAGDEVACMFAYAFNRSDFSKRRKRWALVTDTGTIVTLSDIEDDERPTDPTGFPPVVQAGLTMLEAVNLADDLNRPRFKHARVPRHWSIPVRPISAEGAVRQ